MKLKVTLNEDLIKIIKGFYFQDFNTKVGIDKFDAFGGSNIWEDMGRILDVMDKVRPETLEDYDGAKFEEETMDKLRNYAEFLDENILYIEEILHQHCDVGLKVGTYTCIDSNRLWKFEE